MNKRRKPNAEEAGAQARILQEDAGWATYVFATQCPGTLCALCDTTDESKAISSPVI